MDRNKERLIREITSYSPKYCTSIKYAWVGGWYRGILRLEDKKTLKKLKDAVLRLVERDYMGK